MATNTDYKRMKDFSEMDWYDATRKAKIMSDRIKNPNKAYDRFRIARSFKTSKMDSVAVYFLTRAVRLEDPRAIRYDKIRNERAQNRIISKARKAYQTKKPQIDKIIKNVYDRTFVKCDVSLTCSHPFWNYKYVYINIGFVGDDFDYNGYTSSPKRLNNHKRSILGKNLSKINTIANRHDLDLFKYGQDLFIAVPLD